MVMRGWQARLKISLEMAHEIVQAAVQLNDKSVQPSFSSPYLLSSSLRSVQLYSELADLGRLPRTVFSPLPTAPIRRPRGADRDPTRSHADTSNQNFPKLCEKSSPVVRDAVSL